MVMSGGHQRYGPGNIRSSSLSWDTKHEETVSTDASSISWMSRPATSSRAGSTASHSQLPLRKKPTMTDKSIEELQARLRNFAADRDWEQFHDSKNLTMALAGEVGELIEHFQWLTPDESWRAMEDAKTAEEISDELADVMIYLSRLADVLGVDLLGAAVERIERNENRYPAEQVRGRADIGPAETPPD